MIAARGLHLPPADRRRLGRSTTPTTALETLDEQAAVAQASPSRDPRRGSGRRRDPDQRRCHRSGARDAGGRARRRACASRASTSRRSIVSRREPRGLPGDLRADRRDGLGRRTASTISACRTCSARSSTRSASADDGYAQGRPRDRRWRRSAFRFRRRRRGGATVADEWLESRRDLAVRRNRDDDSRSDGPRSSASATSCSPAASSTRTRPGSPRVLRLEGFPVAIQDHRRRRRGRDRPRAASRRLAAAQVVVVGGGIGPTKDDVTRDGVAKGARRRRSSPHAGALELVRACYARRGLPVPAGSEVQALLPQGSGPVPNRAGTAPGHPERGPGAGDRRSLVVPGVPGEFRAMIEDAFDPAPALASRARPGAARWSRSPSRGSARSTSARRIADLMERGRDPLVGSYPKRGRVVLTVESRATPPDEAARRVERGARRDRAPARGRGRRAAAISCSTRSWRRSCSSAARPSRSPSR